MSAVHGMVKHNMYQCYSICALLVTIHLSQSQCMAIAEEFIDAKITNNYKYNYIK